MLWHHKEPRDLKKDRGEVKGEKKKKERERGRKDRLSKRRTKWGHEVVVKL